MPPLCHDEVLDKICGVCYRKEAKGNKLRNITATTLEYIRKHHHSEYEVASGDYARKVCASCNKSIQLIGKAGGPETVKAKLVAPMYESIHVERLTRSSSQCQCFWCKIWRMNGGEYNAHVAAVRAKPGRPPVNEDAQAPAAVLRCEHCQGEVSKGVSHKCNVTSMETNTLDLIEAMPSTSKQRIVSKLLDNLREDQGANPKKPGTLMLATRGSHFKTITIGPVRPQQKFTHQDILRMKVGLGFSGKQTLGLGKFLYVFDMMT